MGCLRACLILALVAPALAACGWTASGSADWEKVGSTQEAGTEDMDECRQQANDSLGTQAAIDSDIEASRTADWKAAGTYNANMQQYNEAHARQRDQMITRCMILRGYLIEQ